MRPYSPVLVIGLATLIVFGVAPAASATTTVSGTFDGITYSADSTDFAAGATVTAYNAGVGGPRVVIPETVTLDDISYPVTTIGAAAFAYKALTSAVVPDSVTTIGGSAFQDNRLTSVTIGNSVTNIGNNAFYINALTSVTIPDNVTTIGAAAFYTNALTAVTIPNSVTTIGGQAFFNNNLLSSVKFLGAAPILGSSSLGSNSGLLVSYFSRYEAPAVSGGFTTPSWTANSFNNTYTTQALVDVNYSTNGGDGPAPAASQPPVDSRLTAPADPSRAGHTFAGWFTAASGGTAWNFTTKVTADTSLYAQWIEVLASTITLNLDLEVGTTVAGAPVTVSGVGLRAGSAHSLVVRSTPQTIASGTASSTGTFTARGVMPTGLAAGQHTVTLSAIAADGSAISRVAYLTIAKGVRRRRGVSSG